MEKIFVLIVTVGIVVGFGIQAAIAWFQPGRLVERDLRVIDYQKDMPRFLFLLDHDARRKIIRSPIYPWYLRIVLTGVTVFFYFAFMKVWLTP